MKVDTSSKTCLHLQNQENLYSLKFQIHKDHASSRDSHKFLDDERLSLGAYLYI